MESYAKGLVKHVSQEELKKLIRKEKDKHVHERLLFIYQLYLGDGVQKAYKRMCISEQTGYNWLKQWNEKGYEGLVPNFSGGNPPKLTKEQKGQLKKKLKSGGNWLTSQVRALIKKEFGVTYSIRHLARILRDFGMHYAKPYSKDYRQPENAKELLAEAIEEATANITQKSIIGFLDQAAPQTTDNRQRFWSFDKPRITRNTAKYRANTFGFYPINGKEVVEFMERSTSLYVRKFLRKIRMKNPKRRRVSQIFVKSKWSLKETIRTTFHRLAKKSSFMKGWLDIFMPKISKLL